MTALTLRRRILLTVLPLLLLLAIVGGAGAILLRSLGQRSETALRENYDSILAMVRLGEGADRVDVAFQLALEDKEEKGKTEFRSGWELVNQQLAVEKGNITIFPDEPIMVEELETAVERYEKKGKLFFRSEVREARERLYQGNRGRPGLRQLHQEVKEAAGRILHLNQEEMENANQAAQKLARFSLFGFGLGLALASLLAVWFSFRLVRLILTPIEAVKEAAQSIGAGQLHRTVPVFGKDELGQLAEAFNAMTERLRRFRLSNLQKLWRAQQTGQATIETFRSPVLVVDPEGRVELANAAARQAFGVTPPAEAGEAGAPWIPPASLRQPLAEALSAQQTFLTETFDQALTLRFEGSERFYLPQVRPIKDSEGDTLGAAVVLTDVTRFRLLDQVKGDLVATVSHELKTPLTGLRLALHLLLEETVGPLTPKQTELLVDARDNAERLLAQVEQLLALARLEDRRELLEIGPVSPATLLQTAADGSAARAADRRIEVVVDDASHLPPVAADAVRIGTALGNLLTNAITHTPPGGKVTLSAAAEGENQVRLSVVDTGIGIGEEHLPHLFEKFYRIHEDNRPPGTGLGLAIVREIARAHGGEVTCDSAPGAGAAFHLTLPVWGASS
jgi:signal transduction histidine kinase